MAEPPPRASRAKSIGHYVLMKTIGEGTFGKVKLGTHILTGERVAVKVLEKERIQELADVERVAREIHILKLIRRCRHIIQLYEIIETPRQLYLIMEYAPGGELFDYIVERGKAEEHDACRFLHQILAGVERVHQTNVVHRDMKPENLLLDERECIKIVDFGLSNTFQDGQLLQTACGSPCYAAPEMIAGNQYFPPMVDVWSCGVILFALVCGCLPFEDQNHSELYKKILNAEYEVPAGVSISKEVTELIAGMLTTDPAKRMTLAEIRGHVWYRQIPEASLKDRVDDQLDETILSQLEAYGFPREYAIKCLQNNKHNHVTTTYYLIKEKQLRSEDLGLATRRAIADIDATCFEAFDADEMLPAALAVATPSRCSRAEEPLCRSGGRSSGPSRGATRASSHTARLKELAGDMERGPRGQRPPSARGYRPPRRRPTSNDARLSPYGLEDDREARPRSYGVPPAAWRLGSARCQTSGPEKASFGDVSCNTSQPPVQVMQEVTRALDSHGIQFRQMSNYVVRCQNQEVRFQAEILESERGQFLLRFRKASGDARSYKDLCARLLTSMNL